MFPVWKKAEILCVGTELLMGEIVNTNAAYLSGRLTALGIGVYRQAVVGDHAERLATDLREALDRSDLVVISGGLGPTEDDLTKETAAAVFGRRMILHEPSLARIKAYFAASGRTMTANNRKQAMMPVGATVFQNDYGTAPALALTDENGKTAVLLPGPPRELEPIFAQQVEPFLKLRCGAVLRSRNLNIAGMGESAVEDCLPPDLLASKNPTVATYCDPGRVRLRVTAQAADEKSALAICDRTVSRLMSLPLAPYVYGMDKTSPEAALLQALTEKGLTLAVAESCTGGLLLKRLTDIPGASEVIAGGAVTYQTREKEKILGVPHDVLETHTAVSRETAIEMAVRVRERFDSDLGASVTGYAGPGGGTEKEPVGTVYLAVTNGKKTVSRRLSVSALRDRAYVREVAATNTFVEILRFFA